MKNITRALASTLVFLAVSSCAFAEDTQKVQGYAHPTMFGSESQQTTSAKEAYVVGGKIAKSNNRLGVASKDQVLIDAIASDLLETMKSVSNAAVFNTKDAVLRSELAVCLSEAFGLNGTTSKKYADVPAGRLDAKYIYGATNAGVMIGYPDNNFRPDQRITKAEVFATIAQLIDVATDKSLVAPQYKGEEVQYIPTWAIAASKEVVNSGLLNLLPEQEKIAPSEYLTKEQLSYLVGSLKQYLACNSSLKKDANAPAAIKNYVPTALTIKLADRLSARVSNVGDKFSAKTTKDASINGECFPAGSVVKGEVVEVSRPGVNNPGYIKVKFLTINHDGKSVEIPNTLASAKAEMTKDPNPVARLLGMPLSGSGRIVGVAGRTAAAGANVAANGLEELGDELSNVFVDTFSLQPVAGVKNVGNAFVTVGKGVYDLSKLAVSGTFGVLYEVTDELRYLICPKYSNGSSLNPGEELTIVY